MLIQFLSPDFQHSDERGCLVQLVHGGWNQINVITSQKDSIRGNHYHKQNMEAFYVIKGTFQLTLELGKELENHQLSAGAMFSIRPEINHSFHFIEETILVSMYDIGVEQEDGKKDIFSES